MNDDVDIAKSVLVILFRVLVIIAVIFMIGLVIQGCMALALIL